MNRVIPILLLAASALAQSSDKPDKPKLSDDYAKTSLKALVCVSNGSGEKALKDALTDAEVAASTPAEDANLHQLKYFAVLHSIRSQLFDSLLNTAAVQGTPSQTYVDQLEHKTGIAADRACIAAWKDALRSKEAAVPDLCSTEKLGNK